jgi:anti-sigma B factor antagonist
MSVEIKSVKKGNIAVVEIIGDALDASNVQKFRNDASQLLEGQKDVLFDLSKVKFVDSSGIGALLSVLRKSNALSGHVKLCCLQPNVQSLFDLVRMTRLFETFDTQEVALASFDS